MVWNDKYEYMWKRFSLLNNPGDKGRFIIYEMGGAVYTANRYISREWPYLSKRFYTCPFIFPKESEKNKSQNFSPPLNDASKIFRPPPSRRVQNFSPPLWPKNWKCPKYPQNMKKLCFRNIKKIKEPRPIPGSDWRSSGVTLLQSWSVMGSLYTWPEVELGKRKDSSFVHQMVKQNKKTLFIRQPCCSEKW